MPELTILVVDDTPIVRRGTAIMVQTLGYKTDEVANGREALAKMQNRHYSLILMDYNMPDMNGTDCTHEIREHEKRIGSRIAIIGLSASSEANIKERCLKAGMDDYLPKSYTIDELRQIIHKWLHD